MADLHEVFYCKTRTHLAQNVTILYNNLQKSLKTWQSLTETVLNVPPSAANLRETTATTLRFFHNRHTNTSNYIQYVHINAVLCLHSEDNCVEHT